jgi:CheY-like chemotaxis protein
MSIFRILIVDDQRDVRRMLRAGLETLGGEFKVTDVPSGEEAMLVISRQPVDILVADVRLPGISGLELIERARLFNPELKLILITGMTDPAVRQQVAEAGANAFFFKPIEMPAFLGTVERLLGKTSEGAGYEVRYQEEEEATSLLIFRAAQPAPAAEPPVAPEEAGDLFEARLAALCRALGAASLLLFSAPDQVWIKVGNLPEGAAEPSLAAALQVAWHAAGESLRLLRADPEALALWVVAASQACFLARCGETSLLAAVGALEPARSAAAFQSFRQAAIDLRVYADRFVAEQSLSQAAALPPEAQTQEEGLEEGVQKDLETILGKASVEKLNPEQVDAFWEALSEVGEDKAFPGRLSFDQARDLGLNPAPKEE